MLFFCSSYILQHTHTTTAPATDRNGVILKEWIQLTPKEEYPFIRTVTSSFVIGHVAFTGNSIWGRQNESQSQTGVCIRIQRPVKREALWETEFKPGWVTDVYWHKWEVNWAKKGGLLTSSTFLIVCTVYNVISMTRMWVKITHGVSYGIHKDVFCLRAVRLLWVGGRWAAAYRVKGRTGFSVEAQLAESVAGQISWRSYCLAGVWHITTKGFGQTEDCTALINPPVWDDLQLCFSVARPVECKEQIRRYFPSGKKIKGILIWSTW